MASPSTGPMMSRHPRLAAFALGTMMAWPFAASAQDVVVAIDIAMWNGHMDDCLYPDTNICQASPAGPGSADGVRNGIPAGGVRAPGLLRPTVSILIPVPNAPISYIANYTDAKDIIAFSTLLFDRRLANPFPSHLTEGTAHVSLHFAAGTTFTGLSTSCAATGGITPSYCMSIPLSAAFIPGKTISTVIHDQFVLYTQAESIIAQSEALYLSLNP